MAFYQDPDKPRHRPSLIEDLFKLPTKPGLHPLENQSTATLAWLIDRSPVFAHEFVELFLGPGSAPDATLGARTWVTLPNPDGGKLFPDLCIEAADRHLQLLVEVKVASALAQKLCSDGVTRSQEVHYRWAWTAHAESRAAVCAVGTLTRAGGTTALYPGELRASDVTWSEVRDLIERLLAESGFGPETALVALSFVKAIKARIAVDPPSPAALSAWLAAHAEVATQIAAYLRDRMPGATVKKIGRDGAAFTGHRVLIPDVLGSKLRLRVYASPANTAQNLIGEPDALIVGIERDTNGTLEAPASDIFAEAGFLKEKDVVGDTMHRRSWPMEDVIADPTATAASIWGLLSASGVGPWASDRVRPRAVRAPERAD